VAFNGLARAEEIEMLSILMARLRALLRKSEMERELDEELRYHIEQQTEQNIRLGMDSEEARRAARKAFGGVEQAKERSRDARGLRWIEDLWQDLRYGGRMLAKKPGFTLIAVLALTLGIGANTAIFSVVNAILLRPLAFKDPDRLVTVSHSNKKLNMISEISAPSFLDYRDRGDVFESAAAAVSFGVSMNLTGKGEPEQLQARGVTASFFPTLGVAAALGRTFLPEEERRGRDNVVILSYGLWHRRFGAASNILGRTLTLNGNVSTVIGVMPENFRLYRDDELWYPLALTPEQTAPNQRRSEWLWMIARLKPGVSLDQAQAAMNAVAGQIIQETRMYLSDGGWGIKIKPLQHEFVEEIKPALLILLGAVGFVLLIACANVANLLLARAAARRKEVAIRTALGASRPRLIRQLLTESMLLALAGAGLGLLLAVWGVDLLIKLYENNIPRAQEVGVDTHVLIFTLGLSVLTGLFFGLAPALQASKMEPTQILKEGGRGSSGAERALFRNLLVISEIALALILCVGAGLLIKSFALMLDVNPGFRTQNLLTLQVTLPDNKYSEDQKSVFYLQALEKVKALPGVQAAGAVSDLPLSGSAWSGTFGIDGRSLAPGEQMPHADLRSVSHDYLQMMGIPLRTGRYFTYRDTPETLNVIIIDDTLARRYWPNEDPIGKRVAFNNDSDGRSVWREVVGVVGAIKHKALDADSRGTLYFLHSQLPWRSRMNLVARSASDPMSLVSAVRAAIQSVDKDQPIYRVKTMDEWVTESMAQKRFSMLLLGLFAMVALLLAAVGLYGVMSYAVTRRTHEIGVRMALGAQALDVLRLVVRQGMTLALIGAGAGLGGALALTRLLKTLLFGVSATDPLTFTAVPALLAGVALLACWIPARRATKVDPMIVLRSE
jgi:putative ABC transport system permease protein